MRLLPASVVLAIVTLGPCAAALAQPFTDDPLTPGTAVKAAHVTELRSIVGSLRAVSALPAFAFTDAVLNPTTTPIRAIHIVELRSALNGLFDAALTPRPTYTDPTLTGIPIKVVHIQQLRAAVVTVAPLLGFCLTSGGSLTNGATYCGHISSPGQTDELMFTATAGDRIAVHIGQFTDLNDFQPWIRLRAPDTSLLGGAFGTDAASLEAIAPATGTYRVQVGSGDTGFDGQGAYRLTMTHTPGPITVSGGDQGGPLSNAVIHAGEITTGDLDVWTINVGVGRLITASVGETSDANDFRPWIRIWAPNGASLGSASGPTGANINGVITTVAGTYLVLIGSFDGGSDGTGTYQLVVSQVVVLASRPSALTTVVAGYPPPIEAAR